MADKDMIPRRDFMRNAAMLAGAKIRAGWLCMALAAAGLLWGALMALNPNGMQARVFFERGDSFFGDFFTVRTCAEYGYSNDKQEAFDTCYPALGPLMALPFPCTAKGGAVFTGVGILLWALAFAELLRMKAKSLGGVEKAGLLVGCAMSSIMLHEVEWGNQVVYAAAASTLFVAWYDAEERWRRYAAAAALAVASVLKITPAALGVAYLSRLRRAKGEIAFLVAAGIVLFAVPFAWYGGWDGLCTWFGNAMANAKAYVHRGAWGVVPIARTVRLVMHMDVSAPWPGLSLERAANVFMGGACMLAACRAAWKGAGAMRNVLMLAVSAMLLVPGNMHIYTGLYLMPVLALQTVDGMDRVDAACWFALLCPVQIPLGAGCLNHPLANMAFLILAARAFVAAFAAQSAHEAEKSRWLR